MKNVTVYLDSHQAKIYTMDHKDTHPKVLEDKHFHSHHDRHGHDAHKNERKVFFESISKELNEVSEVFLLGSSEVVAEFRHHLEHNHKQLAAKIVGHEAYHSHAMDAEVWKKGHAFYDVYTDHRPLN